MDLERQIQDIEAELKGCTFDPIEKERLLDELAILKMKYLRIIEDDDFFDDLTKEKNQSSLIVRNIIESIVMNWKKKKFIKNVEALENGIKSLSSSIKNMINFETLSQTRVAYTELKPIHALALVYLLQRDGKGKSLYVVIESIQDTTVSLYTYTPIRTDCVLQAPYSDGGALLLQWLNDQDDLAPFYDVRDTAEWLETPLYLNGNQDFKVTYLD